MHFSPTVRLLTSSPLMGEERGEGDRSLQRPLTLALSREGRGNSRSTHRSKSGIFCRINVRCPIKRVRTHLNSRYPP